MRQYSLPYGARDDTFEMRQYSLPDDASDGTFHKYKLKSSDPDIMYWNIHKSQLNTQLNFHDITYKTNHSNHIK